MVLKVHLLQQKEVSVLLQFRGLIQNPESIGTAPLTQWALNQTPMP